MDEQRLNEVALQRILRDNGGKQERRDVLSLNEALRKEHVGGVPGDWGYELMNIPVDDMRVLQLRFPDLISLDPQIQHQAWQKFARDPASAPYKIRRRDGKRGVALR